MLSIVQPNQYYQVFLVQGVGMGLGLMFVFGTTMTMVSQHFRGRRALAMVSGGCRTNSFLILMSRTWSGDLHSI